MLLRGFLLLVLLSIAGVQGFVAPPARSHRAQHLRWTRGHGSSRTVVLAATQASSTAIVPSSEQLAALSGVSVLSASTGRTIKITDTWQRIGNKRTIVAFFTHWGDFNTFEFGQKLLHEMPKLRAADVDVVAVGIGTVEGARLFARIVGFPMDKLYVDPTAAAYEKLNFYKGFGADVSVSPYLKLLPMLMGIGSPGTISEVLRGYFGDRTADAEWTRDYLKLVEKPAFDVLGQSGARPFEVATVRLQNMIDIIPNWETLAPPNKDLITQQGGCLVFEGSRLIKAYADQGILRYTDVKDLVKTATSKRV